MFRKMKASKHLNPIGTQCHSRDNWLKDQENETSEILHRNSRINFLHILPQKPLQDVPLSRSIFLASTAATPMQALFVRKLGRKLLSFS